MAANADAMVREAIKAFRAGKKAEARALLEKATDVDQYNEQAWMWLSAVVDSVEDQRTCLENVLQINPNNQNARQGLRILESKTSTSPLPGAAPAKPAPAREPDPVVDTGTWEIPPTETSSSSALYNPANQVSSSELDQWMANLPIGKTNPMVDEDYDSSPVSSPIDDMFSGDFTDDEEDDEDDPGSRLDTMFGSGSRSSMPVTAGPFSVPDDEMDDLDMEDDFMDDLDLDRDEPPAPPPASKPAPMPAARMSPGREEAAQPAQKGKKGAAAPKQAKQSKPPKQSQAAGGSFYTGKEMESSGDMDPDIYFREIPLEVKATTLPGMGQGVPLSTMMVLAVLVLLNIGAAVALVLQLQGS